MFINYEYNASQVSPEGFLDGVQYSVNFCGDLRATFSSTNPDGIDNNYYAVIVEKIKMDRVTDGRTVLELHWPITVQIEKINDIYLASNMDFNIHEMADSREEVLRQFQISFIHFWYYYRSIDNAQLTGFGKRLKALFENICKKSTDANS